MSHYSPSDEGSGTFGVLCLAVGVAGGLGLAELEDMDARKGSLGVNVSPSSLFISRDFDQLFGNSDLYHLRALDHYGPSPYEMLCDREALDRISDINWVLYNNRDGFKAALREDYSLNQLKARKQLDIDYNALIRNVRSTYVFCKPSSEDASPTSATLLSYANLDAGTPPSFAVSPDFFTDSGGFCAQLGIFFHMSAHGYLGEGHDGRGSDVSSLIGNVSERYCRSLYASASPSDPSEEQELLYNQAEVLQGYTVVREELKRNLENLTEGDVPTTASCPLYEQPGIEGVQAFINAESDALNQFISSHTGYLDGLSPHDPLAKDFNVPLLIQDAGSAYVSCTASFWPTNGSLMVRTDGDTPSTIVLSPGYFHPRANFCRRVGIFLHMAAHSQKGRFHDSRDDSDIYYSIGDLGEQYCYSSGSGQLY